MQQAQFREEIHYITHHPWVSYRAISRGACWLSLNYFKVLKAWKNHNVEFLKIPCHCGCDCLSKSVKQSWSRDICNTLVKKFKQQRSLAIKRMVVAAEEWNQSHGLAQRSHLREQGRRPAYNFIPIILLKPKTERFIWFLQFLELWVIWPTEDICHTWWTERVSIQPTHYHSL